MNPIKISLLGALYTILALFGGLLLGVVVGNVVFELLPGHSVTSLNPVHVVVAALPALGGLLGGSAVWGLLMGRLADADNKRRMALAGALGFAPITLALGILLQILEPIAVRQLGVQFPIHRLFTFFFVPTAFLIAGVSAGAIGLGLRDKALARQLAWRIGLAAAVAFLSLNLLMESFGWQVGAPDAAKRFTMLTVLFVGNLGAALAGGGMIGFDLSRRTQKPGFSDGVALLTKRY